MDAPHSVWLWRTSATFAVSLVLSAVGLYKASHAGVADTLLIIAGLLGTYVIVTAPGMANKGWNIRIPMTVLYCLIGYYPALLSIGYVLRPEPAPILHLTFQEPCPLSRYRKKNVQRQMDSFYSYLVDLGFAPPKEVPPISVGDRPGASRAGTMPGPVYWQTMYINNKLASDPRAVYRLYGDYALTTLLKADDLTRADKHHRLLAAWIAVDYLSSSLLNAKPLGDLSGGIRRWTAALWEIREKCGQSFTDQVLVYTLKAFDDESDKNPNQEFDLYFFNVLRYGEANADNELRNARRVHDILKMHGLPHL